MRPDFKVFEFRYIGRRALLSTSCRKLFEGVLQLHHMLPFGCEHEWRKGPAVYDGKFRHMPVWRIKVFTQGVAVQHGDKLRTLR